MQSDERQTIRESIQRAANQSAGFLSTLASQPHQYATACLQLGLPFCNDDSSFGNGADPSCWNNECSTHKCSSPTFGSNCNLSFGLPNSNGNGGQIGSGRSNALVNIGDAVPTKSDPPSNPTESTDKLLSDELKRLTLQEREKVTEDIHGIAAVVDETPEFVREHLSKFDEEIMKLRRRHARNKASDFAAAYEKALFLNPDLVQHDADFKLMFLRGDGFDAEVAATRYMNYFTTKLELFGLDLLTKQPITLDDLNEDDLEWVKSGVWQPLPQTDRAGRRVIGMFPKHEELPLGNRLVMSCAQFRAFWYLMMASIEHDVEVQRRGSIDIMYLIGGDYARMPRPSPETTKLPKQLNESLPRRVVAMHALYDDPMIGPLIIILPLVVSKFRLIRFRSHFGSYLEGMYALKSFGIPVEDMPVDKFSGSFLDNTNHRKYLQERKEFEDDLAQRQAKSNAGRIIPSSRDVLLGRGRPYHFHVGNRRLTALIEQQKARYDEAGTTYGKKNSICEEVVDMVHESGGRFLKKQETDTDNNDDHDSAGWEVVRREMARDKTRSHYYRNVHCHEVSDLMVNGVETIRNEDNLRLGSLRRILA